MKKIALTLVSITLCACQPKPNLEECWSADTKTSLMSLVRSSLLEKIASEVATAGKPEPTAEDKSYFDKALVVTIDTYHAISRNNDAGSLSCGANVSMTFTNNNGKTIHANDAATAFNIYKAENGSVFSLENTLPLVRLIEQAK